MAMQRRLNDHTLRIACPYCRDRNGKPRFHTHGTGGKLGPWFRLSHCADSELLPRYRGQRFLSYEIIAPSAPRVIKGPPLVPKLAKPKRAPSISAERASAGSTVSAATADAGISFDRFPEFAELNGVLQASSRVILAIPASHRTPRLIPSCSPTKFVQRLYQL
jgi:hypothetical protein